MKFVIKFIREALGRIIILIDLITRPRKQKRSPEAQAKVEAELNSYSLYQFYACPFCIKTRRALHRLTYRCKSAMPKKAHSTGLNY